MVKASQIAMIEVIAAADDDFDAVASQAGGGKTCVGQGGGGGFQDQELLWLSAFNGARHDAVFGGVKRKR
jgi:hypothetical protein